MPRFRDAAVPGSLSRRDLGRLDPSVLRFGRSRLNGIAGLSARGGQETLRAELLMTLLSLSMPLEREVKEGADKASTEMVAVDFCS